MKKRVHHKKSVIHKRPSWSAPLKGLSEFLIGFLIAVVLCFLLATLFREQIFQLVIDLTGE